MTFPRFTRTSQPQLQAGIDWGNPLANGLISFWTPAGLIKTTSASAPSGGARVGGIYGAGVLLNGTSESLALGAGALSAPTGTRIALIKVGSASGTRNISAMGTGGTGFRLNGTSIEIVNTLVASIHAATSAVSSGEVCSVAIGYTAFNTAIYKNGKVLSAQTTNTTPSLASTADYIGQTGASSQYFDGVIYAHLSFNRKLRDAEIKALSDNPWQILQPTNRSIWSFNVAAVGTVSNAPRYFHRTQSCQA
jgi:hypothetical protein